MNIMFRPLGAWHGAPTSRPERSRFKTHYSDTLELLKRELRQLGAREVVIQLDLAERDIRLDGLPRANARPSRQGVVVAFESKYGPLKYATDTYDDWQDNVRAIAVGLEALRKVDRHGITKRGEQYAGWKALPASTEPVMTTEQASQFLQLWGTGSAKEIWADPEVAREAYRRAARRLHPDAGGSTEDFQCLQEAKRILDAHHGSAR